MNEQLQVSDPCYRNLVIHIRSERTKQSYICSLSKFKNYCQVEKYSDLLYGEDVKRIQSMISDFLIHSQAEETLSSSTIALYKSTLKFFYEMNDITSLNWKKISKVTKEYRKVAEDRPYTTEEISKMLEKADHRGRILILLICSSGMRIGSIHTIKIAHLEPISDLYKITVYKNTREEYITLCSPECRKAIDDYLEYRKRYGEKIKPESPLIREQFNKNNPEQCAYPKQVKEDSIVSIIYRVIYDAGIREKKNVVKGQRKRLHDVMQSHGLRKFFQTQIVTAGMPLLYSEMLMGHKQGLALQSYVKPTTQQLLDEYLKVVDSVTIAEENRLKKKVHELMIKTDRIEAVMSEIDILKKKIGIS